MKTEEVKLKRYYPSEEKIRKVAEDFAKQECEIGEIDFDALYKGFCNGAKWALSHQWISTKDEKPDGKKMLYILRDGSLSLGYFVNDDYQRFWMPIPPPPEARKEGEKC